MTCTAFVDTEKAFGDVDRLRCETACDAKKHWIKVWRQKNNYQYIQKDQISAVSFEGYEN